MSDEAISHFSAEAKVKVESKWARLVIYDDVKGDLPKQMKGFPIAAIPHKSKEFQSILDLSFESHIIPHGRVHSVNENREKTAPGGVTDHIGHVLMRLIHAFSEALEYAKIGISRIVFGG